MRFWVAGLALYVWTLISGARSPTLLEWRSTFLVAPLIFVVDFGLVFWAEQRVPSGLTAVMMATIPMFMVASEIVLLGTARFTLRLVIALAIGVGGVAVLTGSGLRLGGAPIDRVGAAALIAAALGWSIGSVLTRKLPLPASKMMSSASQMLAGGVLLSVTAAVLGEWRGFHASRVSRDAWFALLYLIVAGSIVAFTAYVWLLHHESPSRVSTYAYVNPVVAVLLGVWLGHEALNVRTIIGSLLVLVSVIVITTMRSKPPLRTNP